jgi:hypothetical protein
MTPLYATTDTSSTTIINLKSMNLIWLS